jgi:hypothetical protein
VVWLESRLNKPGGAGAARDGSICELVSNELGVWIGGDLKDVGAPPPTWGKRGDDVAETIPSDMSVPGV